MTTPEQWAQRIRQLAGYLRDGANWDELAPQVQEHLGCAGDVQVSQRQDQVSMLEAIQDLRAAVRTRMDGVNNEMEEAARHREAMKGYGHLSRTWRGQTLRRRA